MGGRERRVPSERVDLPVHLEQHVLGHFFGVFFVPKIAERELVNLGAILIGQLTERALECFDYASNHGLGATDCVMLPVHWSARPQKLG